MICYTAMITLATYLHGEQILYIFVAVLVFGLAVPSLLSFFLVKFFRSRLGNKAYLLAPLPFAIAAVGLWLAYRADAPNQGPPQALTANEARELLKSSSSDVEARLSYSGMVHFHNHLFVSSNIGLLELEGTNLIHLHRVQRKYSVVSGPWLDTANGLLWITDDQTQELLNYDGSTWHRVAMPDTPGGSPGLGILAGIRPSGGSKEFLLAAGG